MYNPYKNYAYYIHGAIWERYYGLGGPRATTDIEFELGPPVSDIEPYIHTLPPEVSSHGTQFRYQNFEGGALDHNVGTGEVFEIHGAIFAKWCELGYASGVLGLVTSDEREAALSPIGTDGRVSDFEGGHIHWHRTGGHGGKSYETHGAIDAIYCAEGGSGGDLGFPVSDEYVNPSGYPQSDFEGGYITTTDGVTYEAYGKDDTTPPTLTIEQPICLHDNMIDLSGTAYDVSDILNNKVLIIVDSDRLDYCPCYSAPYDPASQTWSIPNVPVEYGNNEITVYAQDTTHNIAEKTTSVYLDYPDFTFAQVTDMHIGSHERPLALTKLGDIYRAINKKNPKPDFILITGDILDIGGNVLSSEYWWSQFIDITYNKGYLDSSIKIYTIPGNHDRYTVYGIGDYLGLYHKYIDPKRPAGIEDLIAPDNYTFEHKGHLFIGLDSGKDYDPILERDTSPEGTGLALEQMEKLRNLPSAKPKIIFMHHPAINDENDKDGDPPVPPNGPGGNGDCIAHYRSDFIDYCKDNNVQLILTGHTHKDKIFNADGEEFKEFLSAPGSFPPLTCLKNELPLFIQTNDPGGMESLCGYFRLIDIKDGVAVPYLTEAAPSEKTVGSLKCPAHLHAYDSQGRHTGLNASGGVETNIPDSFYIGRYNYSDPNETETILLYNTTEEYRFEIVANLTEEEKASPEIESFNFTVEQQTDDTRTTIAHLSVPLTENTTATLPINLTTTAYTMEIDYDGDGATDETEDPDFTETNYAPTAAIIAPETGSIYNASEPVEFNGTGRDPEDGILTDFSLVWYSDINGVIGAGERFSTENLSCGAHRITLMVNDSTGLTSTQHIALTITEPTTTSPSPAWYLHNNSTMYRTTTNPAGNLTIATDSSNLWIADEPAQTNLSFLAGIWTGRITLETALPSGQNFSVEVGNYSSDIFTASGRATINGDGNTTFDFQITANSFSTQKDDYLAVNITNTTTDIEVKTGGTHSYITAPDNAPAYPVPELPSIILVSTALIMLAGVLLINSRRSEEK